MKTGFIVKICFLICLLVFASAGQSQSVLSKTIIIIDTTKIYQQIENFGASDAWACQYAGNWPDAKKEVIANWLFSNDTLEDGSPKGIGLSLWRCNIGTGSFNQGENSGIIDEWHRTPYFLKKDSLLFSEIAGQAWFISAAKKRGVTQFLGFFNSPPVNITNTGKGLAQNGVTNIHRKQYGAFAKYAVKVLENIKKVAGVSFQYVSPVNEPQWNWSDPKQEGTPYTNAEIYTLVKTFSKELVKHRLSTEVIIPETAHIKYLFPASDKPGKDNQLDTFFNPLSKLYVGQIPLVKKAIAYHSYFTTSPQGQAIRFRKRIQEKAAEIAGLSVWQSEYCVLGENAGEISGKIKDLGMATALYIAKVIHNDLVYANASAWQWWLALSPYDSKDGLIYIDKNKMDGSFAASKTLWVLGNYSFFVKPGMKRVGVDINADSLLVSAYQNNERKKIIILTNTSKNAQRIACKSKDGRNFKESMAEMYITNTAANLKKTMVALDAIVLPPETVATVVVN